MRPLKHSLKYYWAASHRTEDCICRSKAQNCALQGLVNDVRTKIELAGKVFVPDLAPMR